MRDNDRSTAAAGVVCCPFCRSQDVHTTEKAVSDTTYRRCSACGEIWNPLRSRDVQQPRMRGRY
jgi:hypothetical protein